MVSKQRFSGKLADAGTSCFRLETFETQDQATCLSFPDRGQLTFPARGARADLKATLEKGPKDGWTTGSKKAVHECKS